MSIPTEQPIIHPVFKTDSYVFTTDFYSNGTNQSLLEELTTKYLRDEAISEEELTKVYDDVKTWNDLERFYYIPVLSFLTIVTLCNPRATWLNPLL